MQLDVVGDNLWEARHSATLHGCALHLYMWSLVIAHLLRCLLQPLAIWGSSVAMFELHFRLVSVFLFFLQ